LGKCDSAWRGMGGDEKGHIDEERDKRRIAEAKKERDMGVRWRGRWVFRGWNKSKRNETGNQGPLMLGGKPGWLINGKELLYKALGPRFGPALLGRADIKVDKGLEGTATPCGIKS